VFLYERSLTIPHAFLLQIREQLEILAKYVGVGKFQSDPANKENMVVPITAPLFMPGAAVIGLPKTRMQLILPSDFDLSDAPPPLDSRLRLVEIPQHVCAVQSVLKKGAIFPMRAFVCVA